MRKHWIIGRKIRCRYFTMYILWYTYVHPSVTRSTALCAVETANLIPSQCVTKRVHFPVRTRERAHTHYTCSVTMWDVGTRLLISPIESASKAKHACTLHLCKKQINVYKYWTSIMNEVWTNYIFFVTCLFFTGLFFFEKEKQKMWRQYIHLRSRWIWANTVDTPYTERIRLRLEVITAIIIISTRSCASHDMPVSFDQRRECLSFLLVHQAFWTWCRSRFPQHIRS